MDALERVLRWALSQFGSHDRPLQAARSPWSVLLFQSEHGIDVLANTAAGADLIGTLRAGCDASPAQAFGQLRGNGWPGFPGVHSY